VDAACTIVAKPNLAHARVLARSFRERHPELPFVVGLSDRVDGFFDPAAEPFELAELEAFEPPDGPALRFRHEQQELSYAVTPLLLEHLLDRGFRRVLFFKQESMVLARHDATYDLLADDAIVLTPHLLEPLVDVDRELEVLLAGTYNLGFLGIAEAPPARAFLAWWQRRLRTHCEHAIERGLHFEQRWIDLVPGMFDGVRVLRDPAANVGHWSLPERRVELAGDAVLVDGRPCRLFRFSGYDPDRPAALTRYNERLDTAAAGDAGRVFERYRRELLDAGHERARRWPYAYGRFANGVRIPRAVRSLYASLGPEAERLGDPFGDGFWDWLTAPDDAMPGITRLWAALWRERADVRAAYPRAGDEYEDRRGFNGWATNTGRDEHDIPDEYPVLAG
jgi:hypothetical protein